MSICLRLDTRADLSARRKQYNSNTHSFLLIGVTFRSEDKTSIPATGCPGCTNFSTHHPVRIPDMWHNIVKKTKSGIRNDLRFGHFEIQLISFLNIFFVHCLFPAWLRVCRPVQPRPPDAPTISCLNFDQNVEKN